MSSALGVLGAGVGAFFGGPTGAAVGGSIGGAMDANQQRADAAASAQDFSASQYANRYQIQVKDMQQAGLNPMLAYMQAPGAAPQGVTYQPQNVFERAASDYSSAYNVERIGRKTEADTENVHAQTDTERERPEHVRSDIVNRRADTLLKQAQEKLALVSADQGRSTINLLEHQAKEIESRIRNLDMSTYKLQAETANLPYEQKRLIAVAAELTARIGLISRQAATEAERRDQMFWLATKTMKETDLLQYDIEAIENAGNLSKQYGQYKGAIDTMLDVSNAVNNFRGRRSTTTRSGNTVTRESNK